MAGTPYDKFIRERITELRLKKNVSEHRMSLDLDKSGSYIRGITSGAALPSLKELFKIMDYFELTPGKFFAPLEADDSRYHQLCEKMGDLDDSDLEKIEIFLNWIVPER